MPPSIPTGAFLAFVASAAWCDLRTGRIPNRLTLTGAGVALLLRAAASPGELAVGLAAAAAALLAALPLFALGALGGGDGKLLVMVAAFAGLDRLPYTLVATALVGGAMALAQAGRRGVLLPVLLNCRAVLRAGLAARRGELPRLGSPGAVSVPYGVAIAVGGIVGWFA